MEKKAMAIVGIMMLAAIGCATQGEAEPMSVENGRKVTMDYTLTIDGEVVDSSAGQEPLVYTQGAQEIIPGLEKQITGMKVGEGKKVTVSPQEAYGEVHAEAFREISRAQLPADMQPEVGMMLGMSGPQGEQIPVRVTAVTEENITIDLNHPLAGKTLEFDVKIVSVE